ncbi:hypothetical protein [Bernardetia sp.]|uniref:hypothetical protein n=1 Tax=Bernardetia sp. TaxID=1937974 RepID=UPI0025C466B3|nr:hypothetical protein [Bernardetia sp.]
MRFRSVNSYKISDTEHQHFLLENRNDPVTGDSFLEGDEVVFCSVCKSAFLKDSWQYMGNRHCDQRFTLPVFPKAKKLTLQKPIELPFVFADTDHRSSAFFIDLFIVTCLLIFSLTLSTKLSIKLGGELYFIGVFLLFTFRDSLLINRSIGKAYKGLYFIDTATNLPASFWQTLGRNILYWVMNGIFLLVAVILLKIREDFIDADIFMYLSIVVAVIVNVFYVNQNLEKNYSWFDKLLGIRLVKKK